MKTKILLFILCLCIGLSAMSQNACSNYYPFKEGTKFQITNFNKKGKKESTLDYEITSIKNNVASITTKVFDDKNKEITTNNFEVICDANGVSIDFKSMISPEMLKQYKDIEMEISGTNIELPNNLSIGQKLKDAELIMSMNMSGIKMNTTMNMVDRKVNSKESITTNAGSFDCFAISYNNEIKMGLKQTYTIKEWISEGVGTVKSEMYHKSGKLMRYSELTSFTE